MYAVYEIDAGQLWINARVFELAQGREPAIQAFHWEDPGMLTAQENDVSIELVVWIGAERRVIRFLESELAEVENCTEVRSRLLNQLRTALQGGIEMTQSDDDSDAIRLMDSENVTKRSP